MPDLHSPGISTPLRQRTADKNHAYHGIGVSRWNSKGEPPPQALQEPSSIRTDDIPHDAAVKASDVQAEDGPQDEEKRVEAEHCDFLGPPVWERDPQ